MDPVIAPALSIQPIELPDSTVMDLDLFDLVIVTSKPAATHWIDLIDHVWPQLPLGLKALAVGPGTARLLTDYGVLTQVASPHSSEGVLDHPWVKQAQRVMLVTGQGGRGVIDQGLVQQGTSLTRVECYFRAQVRLSDANQQALLEHECDFSWVTSADAVTAMAAWSMPSRVYGQILTPSARVADAVAAQLDQTSAVISDASDSALMEYLKKEVM